MAKHNEIGILGERIAVKFLISKEFTILERNFHVKGGEIAIIATKNKEKKDHFHMKLKDIVFIEVKTKKVTSFLEIKDNVFAPENNLTKSKRQRLLKAIRHYLSYRKINEGSLDINIMAIIIFIEENSQKAKIKLYENFIL